MPPIFGALADDLTGGLELASMLAGGGVDCAFVTTPALVSANSRAEAIVIAQKTRVIPAAEAVEVFDRGARALLAAGARQLFFKYCATFDSTDQGNIGPCAELLHKLTGATLTAFCPSFPEVGRRVFQGHLFVGDRLVSESPKRFDPLTPMTDPDLVRVLQRQTSMRVGLIPHQVVRAGPEEMRRWVDELVAAKIAFAIGDATGPEDLAALAALTVDWPLMTGNSSIAEYYPALWRERGWLPSNRGRPRLPAVEGAAVVLAGSCADRTFEQLAEFGRHRPVLSIDLRAAMEGRDVAAEAADWARAHLADGPVAIATSAPPDEVERIQALAGREGAAALAERILSEVAVRLRSAGVRRFLISGGETSGAVLERLEIQQLRVSAYQGPGIARAVTLGDRPLAVCLKSGKLGPVEMFLPMLESMAAGD